MEVIEKKSSYTWSKQAMELIDQLVDLNEAQIKDKSLIFDRFYEMWENDGLVVTISRAKDQLNQQRNYIKNCIFLTLPEAEQEKMKEAEEIYSSIKNGQPYKTSAGKIIQAREDEKTRFKKEVHNHNVKLNNRYNSLVLDFENYLRNKNDQKTLTNNFSYDPLPPMVDAQQLRDILERDAKSNIPDGHFKGMAEGEKRKISAV